MWMEALDGNFFRKRGCARFTWADWDQLLGNYRAVSADPAAVALAEDLIEAYPDPKVSLVERDIEAWYATFDRKVIASVWSRFINLVANFNPFFLGPIRNVHKGWTMGWMGAHSKEEMRAKAREK